MDNGKIQKPNDVTPVQTLFEFLQAEQESLGSNHCTINHPKHYTQGRIEVIDFIQDQGMDYIDGNIIKYVCRYKYKNGIEDLRKAMWYLQRRINDLDQCKESTP